MTSEIERIRALLPLATKMQRQFLEAALRELLLRRSLAPLAYKRCWNAPTRRAHGVIFRGQRDALAQDYARDEADDLPLLTLLLGGNRTGKSDALADYGVANAAGSDAYMDTPRGRWHWVRQWMAANAFPVEMIPTGPGRVWFGSPTFKASQEQIRPKLAGLMPSGTTYNLWNADAEGVAELPNGGKIVSKAYKQYDQNADTWEGANIRRLCLDEQPNSQSNLTAGMSRLIDQQGRAVMAATLLRGPADWTSSVLLNERTPFPFLRVSYLDGDDNPHIPQAHRRAFLSTVPEWARLTRAKGIVTQPEGQIFACSSVAHIIPAIDPPEHWTRIVSTDWGARNPHVTWFALVAEEFRLPDGQTLQAGDVVAYRELAFRRSLADPAISSRKLCEMVIEAERHSPEGKGLCLVLRVADPGGGDQGEGDETSDHRDAIMQACELGLLTEPARKGPGSVGRTIELVTQLLQHQDPITGDPTPARLRFTAETPLLWREMQGLRWADPIPGLPARVDHRCPTHGPDTVRYMAQYRHDLGL